MRLLCYRLTFPDFIRHFFFSLTETVDSMIFSDNIGHITHLHVCFCWEIPADKSAMLGDDFRLFQGTIAWDLAKAVKDQEASNNFESSY